MRLIFRNITYFSILFFALVLLDIFVKLNLEKIPYRFISKPLFMIALFLFYIINQNEQNKRKFNTTIAAIIAYTIGNVILIIFYSVAIYSIGVLLFVAGKLFYVYRFSNQRDFQISRVIPFLLFCFIYMIGIMYLITNNTKELFLTTLLYLFSTMLLGLFALLRKHEVTLKSYYLVLAGVLSAIICDTVSVLQINYYSKMFMPQVLIIIFYALSQYFIVLGIIEETKNSIKS